VKRLEISQTSNSETKFKVAMLNEFSILYNQEQSGAQLQISRGETECLPKFVKAIGIYTLPE
jgi:hypothetical protein